MSESKIRIAIVGGGIGGLALARALKTRAADRFDVTVFERDNPDQPRGQGYVIGINNDGLQALKECSCDNAIAIVDAPAMAGFCIATVEKLDVLMNLSTRVLGGGGGLVDRWTFHDLLGVGVDVQKGKRVQNMAVDGATKIVTLTFVDGTTATADVVIGADGVSSAVRAFVCPSLQRHDTGVSSFAAVMPIDRVPATCTRLLQVSKNVLLRILGPGGCSWLMLRANDPSTGKERVVWCMNHSVEHEGDFPQGASTADCLAFVRAKAVDGNAHPDIVALIDATTADDVIGEPFHLFSMHAEEITNATFLDSHTHSRIALLGDAAHSMTTHRGAGANTALQDAADLARELCTVTSRHQIAGALLRYTTIMKARGAKMVKESLSATTTMHVPSSMPRMRNAFMWTVGGLLNSYSWIAMTLFGK